MSAEHRLVGSDRVLAVLTELAPMPAGASLEELVRRTGAPKATVHRALASLVRSGLVDKAGRGQYILGDEFLRLAFLHHELRPEQGRIRPVLERLAERFGETAHYAELVGDDVVYRAKVDPTSGSVRLTSTVGGRNPAYCTAVGKLLLSYQLHDLDAVRAWIGGRTLEPRTAATVTTPTGLWAALQDARRLGYAVDDQETDPGVNCIAFPVFLGPPAEPSGAISVSAVSYRTPLHELVAAADEIRTIIHPSTRPLTPKETP